MSFRKSLLALLAGASLALAGTIGDRGGSQGYGNVSGGGGGNSNSNGAYESPVEGVSDQAVCGTPGNCYANGCEPTFLSEWNVTGVCAAGAYTGCACAKCGEVNGPCDASGCAGLGGMCQNGPYQGCECGGGPPGVAQNQY